MFGGIWWCLEHVWWWLLNLNGIAWSYEFRTVVQRLVNAFVLQNSFPMLVANFQMAEKQTPQIVSFLLMFPIGVPLLILSTSTKTNIAYNTYNFYVSTLEER